MRALYGCDLESYRLTDFGFSDAENTLPSFMPTGKKATEENVTRILKSMQTGIPFCFDYDDFNSQHSILSMQTVMEAWLEVFCEDISEEQIVACKWAISSLEEMTFNVNGTNYKAYATLFSGWRLTSFINTV